MRNPDLLDKIDSVLSDVGVDSIWLDITDNAYYVYRVKSINVNQDGLVLSGDTYILKPGTDFLYAKFLDQVIENTLVGYTRIDSKTLLAVEYAIDFVITKKNDEYIKRECLMSKYSLASKSDFLSHTYDRYFYYIHENKLFLFASNYKKYIGEQTEFRVFVYDYSEGRVGSEEVDILFRDLPDDMLEINDYQYGELLNFIQVDPLSDHVEFFNNLSEKNSSST